MSKDLQFLSDVCIVLAAIFSLWAYRSFRISIERKIEESSRALADLEDIEHKVGGIDPDARSLRRTVHVLVNSALRSVLPSPVAYCAIGFAALSGVLGILSISTM